MGEKKSFVVYFDYRQHLELLTAEEQGQLFMAMFDYGETGKDSELEGAARMAFSFIKAQMDRDTAKYKEICRKRKEAGKQGGRPSKAKDDSEKQTKANKANGFSEKQMKANKADNDTDTDNDTDNDTDSSSNKGNNANEISAVFNTFEHCGFQITGYTSEELLALVEDYSAEWVIEALKRSADRGNKTLGYVKGILNSWNKQGAMDNGVTEKKQPDTKPKIDETMNDLDELF